MREKNDLNKLVVFVGAGVSRNVLGMPSWEELIIKMADAIGYSRCDLCKHKKDCELRCSNCAQKGTCSQKCYSLSDYSSDEYLKIPQYVFNKSKDKYNDIISTSISNSAFPDAPLSKAIFELNPAYIITTNYDRVLETSDSVFCKQYEVIVTDKDLLNATKSKYIIKMHGDVLLPETLVLKEQDYLEYSQKHVLIELFIKSLLADHTILFLGYSLNDYNIKLIISWINFLRSQNDALSESSIIGYIVLDEDTIDNNLVSYFNSKCIKVINIRNFPLIKSIPPQLGNEKGMRLYSFLSIVQNPHLENDVFSQEAMENITTFLVTHRICDYELLLNFLHINQYEKKESRLQLYFKEDYSRLTTFFTGDSENATLLKQVFLNVGIQSLYYSEGETSLTFMIPFEGCKDLFSDKCFSLYLQNQYSELLSVCLAQKTDVIKNDFYRHFLIGYKEIEDDYKRINFEMLNKDDQVVFLHNSAIIETFRTLGFDSSKPTHFISNEASGRDRKVFQPYLDIYEGNTSARMKLTTSLEKHKRNISARNTYFSNGRIYEIYNMQNIVYSHYLFRYSNHLFILGFNDAEKFFRPYIEAIVLACTDAAESPSEFMGMTINNERFTVSSIDLDIITKYISTKDLLVLIDSSGLSNINASIEMVSHVVACFINLVDSLIISQTYGFRDSSIKTLSNLALLLTKMDLSWEEKELLSASIQKLFEDSIFNERFWNTNCSDFRECIKIFSKLLNLLIPQTSINCIESIIAAKEFFTCAFNCGFNSLRNIIKFFLCKENNKDYNEKIYRMIDAESNINRKIILLRLFYKHVFDDEKAKAYRSFIENSFLALDTSAIIDFTFSGWLEPTQEDISALKIEVLNHYRNKNSVVRSFPDPYEDKLECIILLYITGKIDDISMLDELTCENTYLRFLLHPDSFDYREVDFSNYMWVNFARHSKYMSIFVDHKTDIIPRIKERIKKEEATETEKKILFGYLLQNDEIWSIEY